MSEQNQFYKLKNLNEDQRVIASNSKFRTVYFKFDVGRGLPKHSLMDMPTIYVIKAK